MKQNNATPSKKRPIWIALALFTLALSLIAIFSASMGNSRGQRLRQATEAVSLQAYLDEQYDLALADLDAGELERARQRLQYIFIQNSSYKDAADKWVEISLILNVTRTPTAVPATITPTPTQDLRPQPELLDLARGYFNAKDWDKTLETLSALRKANADYETVAVDGMIYTALRNRGVDKILYNGELEGGLYDFALAEKFTPLDRDAAIYREWARLYLLGNAFWVAYPEIAASYYGQVAGAAPNLTDASGMSAFYRYWMSLVHIAEQHEDKEDWCAASTAYNIALKAGNSPTVQTSASEADQKCLALTPSATPTSTSTITATATATFAFTPAGSSTATSTMTATLIVSPSNTPSGPILTPTVILPTATDAGSPIPPSDTPIVADTPTVPPPAATNTPVPPSLTPEPPPLTNTPAGTP